MCFTCFLCQFVFNKRFLKIYCLSVHSFFLVSFTSMYTTLKIISRKFLGVSLIWTFFSHVGAIFFKQPSILFLLSVCYISYNTIINFPLCRFHVFYFFFILLFKNYLNNRGIPRNLNSDLKIDFDQ